VSPAKTAELIEMPFGLRTQVGPGNHVLDGSPDLPMERGNFQGEGISHCTAVCCIGTLCGICAKTAELIEIPFGTLSRVDPRNHVLDGGADPTWEGGILRGTACLDILKFPTTL